jgi:hypothetical protein
MSITRIKSYGLSDGAVTTEKISNNVSLGVKISNIQIANSSYSVLDDTAVALEGGYIVITGAGFASGCQVIVGANTASSTTFVNSTTIRAQVGAADAGTKTVYVVNTDGGTAIRVNGLTYSATPTWVTGSTLTEAGVDEAISIQLDASLATSYQLQTGSTLPAGLSLAANGLLTGTVTGIEDETTYSFTIEAIDTENQESPRSFSITITSGDEYFYATTLLLNGNGTNGANNNTFVDSSTNNFAITRNGNVAQGTFSPFSAPDGRWSAYFDGTGDYLTFANGSDFAFGTGDFTVELWAYANGSSTTHGLVASQSTGGTFWASLIFSGTIYWQNVNGSSNIVSTSFAGYYNQWTHIAFVRSSGTTTIYLNGVAKASAADSTNYASNTGNIDIGRDLDNSASLTGWASNVRIVKGTAVYTSAFTPPTAPLTAITNTSLLTCQSNRFKDNSTNNFAIARNGDVKVTSFSPFAPTGSYSAATNGASGYFDGTGDYLEMPNNSVDLQDQNFCIEIWCYPTRLDQNAFMMVGDADGTSTPGTSWYMSGDSSRGSRIHISSNGYTVATVPILNSWNHVAMIRSGGTLYGFVNGVQTGTVSVTGTVNDGSVALKPGIGTAVYGSVRGFWQGWLSDARVTVGSTVYSVSGFTPPTTPLTSISGTSFLCNFTNGGIIDYTGKNNLETVADAQIDTTTKKYGTGSMEFDGTGDYLLGKSSENYQFRTGDFTIEFWLYRDGNNVYQTIADTRASGTATPWAVLLNSSNQPYILITSDLTSTISVPLQTWTHVAISRSSGTLRIFVDGVQGYSNTHTNDINPTGNLYIGRTVDNQYYLDGYIDDLRITKGIARYTSNFTPPISSHGLR